MRNADHRHDCPPDWPRGFTQPEQARRRRVREDDEGFPLMGLLLLALIPFIFLVSWMGSALVQEGQRGLFIIVFAGLCMAVVVAAVCLHVCLTLRAQRRAAALSAALEDLAAVLPDASQPGAMALAVKVAGLDARAARRACAPALTVLDDLEARGELDAHARRVGQRLRDLCSTR